MHSISTKLGIVLAWSVHGCLVLMAAQCAACTAGTGGGGTDLFGPSVLGVLLVLGAEALTCLDPVCWVYCWYWGRRHWPVWTQCAGCAGCTAGTGGGSCGWHPAWCRGGSWSPSAMTRCSVATRCGHVQCWARSYTHCGGRRSAEQQQPGTSPARRKSSASLLTRYPHLPESPRPAWRLGWSHQFFPGPPKPRLLWHNSA